MRLVTTLALLALLCIAAPAWSAAARGVASASIVVPVVVIEALVEASPSVSVSVSVVRVRDGANEHVTVAFN